jgi:hypothetical protein
VPVETQAELAIKEVVAIAEQLVNVSSAILVLSVAFVKDVLKDPKRSDRTLLAGAWIGYLFSIVAGIWTRLGVAGTLAATEQFTKFGGNVRVPAGIQICLFLAATSLFTLLAIRGINRHA